MNITIKRQVIMGSDMYQHALSDIEPLNYTNETDMFNMVKNDKLPIQYKNSDWVQVMNIKPVEGGIKYCNWQRFYTYKN